MHDDIIYGTFPLTDVALDTAVQLAVKSGYRWFDTAQIYGNESDLGTALLRCELNRDSFKVTTKVALSNYSGGRFMSSLRWSLAELKLVQVDLLLLHFAPGARELPAALKELAAAQDAGLARAVGISNFPPKMMREAAAISPAKLAVNQVEFHPLLGGSKLLRASVETGISLQAYSPLARGAALKEPVLIEIGRAHHKTPAQVTLRWILQQGVSAVVHSANPANIVSNLASTDFTLSAEEMPLIDTLADRNYRIITGEGVASDWS
jgi:2,5-diketo-D-gluconate reductase B